MAAIGVPPMLWLASRRSGHAARQRARLPRARPPARVPDARLLARLAARARRRPRAAGSPSCRCGCAAPPRSPVPSLTTIGVVGLGVRRRTGCRRTTSAAAARADAGLAFGVLLLLQARRPARAPASPSASLSDVPRAVRAHAPAGRPRARRRWSPPARSPASSRSAPQDGGYSGAFERLTDPNAQTPANTANRLTATASVRARYWDEAFKIHAAVPWLGAGAGAYGTARQRFRTQTLDVQHAHGYVPQTLADLGWFGLIVVARRDDRLAARAPPASSACGAATAG